MSNLVNKNRIIKIIKVSNENDKYIDIDKRLKLLEKKLEKLENAKNN